jgi:hypothetical protein
MKNIMTSLAVAALLVATMPSCKKVSPRKLDGKWNVTAGTYTGLDESPSSKTNTTTTFNGTKETGTSTTTFTSGGTNSSQTIDRNLTITFEFVKDDDSYTKESTLTGDETVLDVFGYYTKDANGFYIPFSGQLDIKKSYTDKTTEKGTFSITGGAGDIKKNSQFILQPTSSTTNYNATIKYFSGSTEVTASTLYKAEFSGGTFTYTQAATTETSTTSTTSETAVGIVVTVDELKGGVMDISYKMNYTTTAGAVTATSKDDYTWTLEQE